MNYKPFSLIGRGDIFSVLDRPEISLMKTGPSTAVYLQGYWAGSVLHSRGESVPMQPDTCVIDPAVSEITLEVANVDPIDPRRRFWKAGDQVAVGRGPKGVVDVFAGLFIYHGMGSGNYYSATSNEVLGGDKQWAMDRADEEGVAYVYHDIFDIPSDPTLSRVRSEAQKRLEKAAAIAA